MYNVAMRNKEGEDSQLATNLSFKEAYSLVVDLRAKKDCNYYWIGTIKSENHKIGKSVKGEKGIYPSVDGEETGEIVYKRKAIYKVNNR